MSGDDSKSVNSQGSTLTQGGREGQEQVPKFLEIFFAQMFPLYPQKKKSSSALQLILWTLFNIIFLTFCLFRIDLSTYKQTVLSKVITAIFYKELIASQPWIISLTRGLVNILLRVLFIPIISTAITSFDCYSEQYVSEAGEEITQSFWRADSTLICFSSIYQYISFALSLIILVFLFIYSAVVNLLIFNHNPKNGGLFSCPNGEFNLLQGIFVFGIVFSQRLLYNWQFWRGVVGVLVPVILIIMIVIQNPYYSFWSNYLAAIPWIIFGVMRLFLEIGYAIEEAIHSIVPLILFLIIGLIVTVIGVSNKQPLQQKAKSQSRSSQSLPKLKDPLDIEIRLRFLQIKELRDRSYLNYANCIYTRVLKQHMKCAVLQFHYGAFLQYYCKNYMKTQSVYKLARQSNPSIPLRFILHCKTKEGGGNQNGQSGGSEIGSIAFTAKAQQAEQLHEAAKSGMLEFFENLTSLRINFDLIYPQLKVIVESEAKSRKCYEELISMQSQNTMILRNYARLLLDIYKDEDTAEIILQRAEMIEDTQQEEPGLESRTDPADGQDQSNLNLVSSGGEQKKKTSKKNKKKKEQGTNVISELQGGNSGQDVALHRLIIILILISHTIAIMSAIVGTIHQNHTKLDQKTSSKFAHSLQLP
ncbi:MAG: hypothetical protein EZS28_016142 [Streblomastix strix]|uniref:TmcB/TmcC TPR repeats domain-containing protein n=1 Tax=Streblomastix strix TaxID=222440 RepID=A0A5J4W0L7_9EUKA|nr:MAG: hypothetical protein EZS28_016142 [Streblomastix strix]